ncbi:Holliday junction branch migration protein RuvA [Schaalia suimastitidis]|uniref:Holliday junction branch migration protein RuvA n=1 Tax=Schaalia suimastitidis TaxID=121163 RepID=UPI000419FFBB|nr:Holliday junction branch migration protein RuvA [Schaalia suimastitidis]
MIAQLHGTLAAVTLDEVIVLVGGIGWRVLVAPSYAQQAHVGDEVCLHTSMVVREDSMTLYGFAEVDERVVFEKLQTVSGIGPRIALAALTVLSPDDLRRAVAHSDLATLQRIPGVGKKSAQRMALDIGDKLGVPAHLDAVSAPTQAASGSVEVEVKAALIQLGWSEAVVTQTLDALGGEGLGSADLLRAALLKLGGQRGRV